MEIKSNKLIVVAGMHRSGTSAITRGLKVMGVALGDRMMPPVSGNNDKGFWEDIDLNALNIEMLDAIGSDWFHLAPIEPGDFDSLRQKGYFLSAVDLLRKKVTGTSVFGFKDPRVAKLLPFWKAVFSHCHFNVSYVLIVRHPLSVVKSLARRDGIEAEQSYLLWLDHVLTSLTGSAGDKRVLVDYDRLMQTPDRELLRVAKCTGLKIDPTALQSYKSEFLDQGLRHTVYELNDLLLDDTCPSIVREVYTALLDVASEKIKFDDQELQNKVLRWSDEFKRLRWSLLLIDKFLRQKVVATQALADSEGKIASLNQVVIERDGQIVGLNQLVTERDGQIVGLNQAVAERDGQIVGLNQLVTERDGQIVGLNQAVAERDGQIASLNQAMAERDGQIASLNQAVAKRDGQIASLNQAMVECDGQIASLDQTIAEQDGQVVRLIAAQKQILDSMSWKITKPLRAIHRNVVNKPYRLMRKILSDTARQFWLKLPLATQYKLWLKHKLFNNFSLVFRWSKAYRNWAAINAPSDTTAELIINHGVATTSRLTSDAYVPLLHMLPPKDVPVSLIAFYLPQFHTISENNAWWGEGFTEWTNVKPAQPLFDGHYQPHMPGELGYYDLLDSTIQHRQIELAKLHGVGGFCFYTYWFGGQLLLEKPVENYLNDHSLDLSFCLCWANENWSRRWDGLDSEILVAQKHSPEDDLAFIQYVAQYMRDERYIRIDGKPLLLVYRPGLLPSAKKTAERWREWCRQKGVGEIYLAYTQSFDAVDPSQFGFDAAVEFPPNISSPLDITNTVKPLSNHFCGTVYDWQVFVERSRNYQKPAYKLFRSVCPSWDNTARRKNSGTIFLNSTPSGYQEWLENAVTETCSRVTNPDERLIFVNAWNEWAEGAHLEPDTRYGYAYLQATRNALCNKAERQDNSILLITHDCHPHGAQFLILEIAKQLKVNGFRVAILALGEGRLLDDFAQVGETLNAKLAGENAVHDFLAKVRAQGTLDTITSTVVCGGVVPQLKELGFRVLSLIHELPGVIHEMKQEKNAETIANFADKIVFPAKLVFQRFREIAPIAAERVVILPQGVLRKNPYKNRRADAHRLVCNKHNLPQNTQIVVSIAYVDARKGPDLFVEIAAQVLKERPQTVFIWIGHADQEMNLMVNARIQALGLQGRVLFIGFDREPMAYYAAASVYALPSREDPFPNVVLESAEVGVPVVAFQGASGAGDFIVEHGGRLAVYLNTDDFARQVCALLTKPAEKSLKSVSSLQQYTLDLLYHLNGFPRISVVVPNYNYEQHIIARLNSIYQQTFPIYEVIVLDDASRDNSVETIKKYLDRTNSEAKLFVNDSNSGTVFRQWQKGISHCKGDLVWIAEADDLACAGFLRELAPAFDDPELMLGYCQSKQIDENGKLLAQNYLEYTKDVSDCWLADYMRDGREEINEALSIKNTIPNVSAVLFRRQALENALLTVGNDLFRYRVAGDWLIYLYVLMQGKVYYSKKNLNLHRRHSCSVTNSTRKLNHLEEVCRVQDIARALTTPSIEVRDKAKAYIENLHKHFDIPQKKTEGPRHAPVGQTI